MERWMRFLHYCAPLLGRLDGLIAGRLFITLILCGIIGLERSTHERASGFRTHILVGVGASLMTMVGAYGFADVRHSNTDPTLLASYVISGIGFLGAGAILRHGTSVRGMTTAASLWGAAGIGIAVGAGMVGLASVAALLILFTLVPLQRLEARFSHKSDAGDLSIHLLNDSEGVGKTLTALARMGILVKRATIIPGAGDSAILRVDLARYLKRDEVGPLVKRIAALKYVTRVDTGDVNLLESDENEPELEGDAVPILDYGGAQDEEQGAIIMPPEDALSFDEEPIKNTKGT